MVIENPFPPFLDWLPWAVLYWVSVVAVLACVAAAFVFAIGVVRHGFAGAAGTLADGLIDFAADMFRLSPRRIYALSWLAVKESIHRRVIVAFIVFVLVLLFAGWFLDPKSTDPLLLYISVLLTTTVYLVLPLAMLLSVFSLPADITSRTLHTVVTKPVRPGEIVLGRMIGFCATGTALLAITGAISYVFVVRGLRHEHEIAAGALVEVDDPSRDPDAVVKTGMTRAERSHRHQVFLRADGTGHTDVAQRHWHEVRTERQGDQTRYVTGPPQGLFVTRVPRYGKLSFRDRSGAPTLKGINVGNEWTYRSYIEGGSLAAAIWRFEGLEVDDFPSGLPVELTLSVFRTYKGDIEKGIFGSLSLRNADTGRASRPINFTAREFAIDTLEVPLQLKDAANDAPIDLFKDLVVNGRLDIEVSCLEQSQYFGAAQADLYLRAKDTSFALNFIKGYLGIWLQMVLVVAFGVMFSTFLNGAVAMLATLFTIIGGFFVAFIVDVATGKVMGGGPVESFFRLVRQDNLVHPLEPGATTLLVNISDKVFSYLLMAVGALLPDFARFDDANYVATGFDIPPDLLGVQFFTAAAYVVPVFVASYFFLKSREVAG